MNNLQGNKNHSFQPYSNSWELSLGEQCWKSIRQARKPKFWSHISRVLMWTLSKMLSSLCISFSTCTCFSWMWPCWNLNQIRHYSAQNPPMDFSLCSNFWGCESGCLSLLWPPPWWILTRSPCTSHTGLRQTKPTPSFFRPVICVVHFLLSLSLYLNVTFSVKQYSLLMPFSARFFSTALNNHQTHCTLSWLVLLIVCLSS